MKDNKEGMMYKIYVRPKERTRYDLWDESKYMIHANQLWDKCRKAFPEADMYMTRVQETVIKNEHV